MILGYNSGPAEFVVVDGHDDEEGRGKGGEDDVDFQVSTNFKHANTAARAMLHGNTLSSRNQDTSQALSMQST